MAKADPIPVEECKEVRVRLDNISRALTQAADQVHHWRAANAGDLTADRFLMDWSVQQLREASRSLLWCIAALNAAELHQQGVAEHAAKRRTPR